MFDVQQALNVPSAGQDITFDVDVQPCVEIVEFDGADTLAAGVTGRCTPWPQALQVGAHPGHRRHR